VRDFSGRLRASGRFLNLSELFESGVDPDSPDTRDERFDLDLECLLDGIAARLPSPGTPPPARPAPYRNPSIPVAARRPPPPDGKKGAAPRRRLALRLRHLLLRHFLLRHLLGCLTGR